uniref:Uncharacterized protein n=1 Tax=Glossina austeni TaxID=7395 RepID=A0A1A9UST5_GLOAU
MGGGWDIGNDGNDGMEGAVLLTADKDALLGLFILFAFCGDLLGGFTEFVAAGAFGESRFDLGARSMEPGDFLDGCTFFWEWIFIAMPFGEAGGGPIKVVVSDLGPYTLEPFVSFNIVLISVPASFKILFTSLATVETAVGDFATALSLWLALVLLQIGGNFILKSSVAMGGEIFGFFTTVFTGSLHLRFEPVWLIIIGVILSAMERGEFAEGYLAKGLIRSALIVKGGTVKGLGVLLFLSLCGDDLGEDFGLFVYNLLLFFFGGDRGRGCRGGGGGGGGGVGGYLGCGGGGGGSGDRGSDKACCRLSNFVCTWSTSDSERLQDA